MIKKLLFVLLLGSVVGVSYAATPSKAKTRAYFIGLEDNATVTSPLTVRFGLKGMGVAPAGVEKAGTGHHHLMIDAALPALDKKVPKDAHHRHFGGGQTQVTLVLSSGKHTLQILFADAHHRPHSPAIFSKKITVNVK